jgi:hypothetical protein
VTSISLPVSIDVGPGNEHESRRLIPLLKNIRIRGIRRPRNRLRCVYADNKYPTPIIMMHLASRGIAAYIKERKRANKKKNKKKRAQGRTRIFDHETYSRIRNSIERFFFAWMKSFRRI